MKKVILFIVLCLLIIAGLFTYKKDKNNINNNIEPKYTIKTLNSDGSKITYWGLGYKVIRYTSVSPKENFKSNKGVKIGSWFMQYKMPKEKPQKKENEKPIITQDEPVTLSLYVDNAFGGLDKVNELHETWVLKKDICVFGAIFSDERRLESDYFQNIWKKYVVGNENYKLGWHINFSLEDGTVYDKTILDPKDAEEFFEYLEVYLYDSAHPQIGVWYSHLEQIENDTIITSMKLTSGDKFEMIKSPIEVKVFAYEHNDEIDTILDSENKVYTALVYND